MNRAYKIIRRMNGCMSGWMRSSSSRTHAHALAAQYLRSLNEEENKLVFPAFPALAGGGGRNSG